MVLSSETLHAKSTKLYTILEYHGEKSVFPHHWVLKNSIGGSIHNQNKTQYNMGTANLNLACNRTIIKLQLHIDCEAV